MTSGAAQRFSVGRIPSRAVIFDASLVALLAVSVVVLTWGPLHERGPVGLIIQIVFLLTLLVRRRYPLAVLSVSLVSTIALVGVARWAPDILLSMVSSREQGWLVFAVPFAAYSALAYGRDRRWAWVLTVVITIIGARLWEPSIVRPIAVGFFVLLPALLGSYTAALTDRAERAERDQLILADQARVDERVRLAAEMHDVVTHRVSLMVLQAGALGVTATDTATRAAAEDLRAAGCQALEELRDLVGVLRAAPREAAEDDLAPRAGGRAEVPDFDALIGGSSSVGVAVELDREGGPELVSPVVARTAYRILQESLTNVHKHAPGATARVSMRFGGERVSLRVSNTAPELRVDHDLTASGSGTGLLGLRQRIELVSGTLRAGPTPDGGFEVSASLPAFVPTPAPADRPGRPSTSPDTGPARDPGPLRMWLESARTVRPGRRSA